MQGMQTFWVVFLIAIVLGYVIAFTRKGRTSMAMPGRKQDIYTPASPDEVFDLVKRMSGTYKVDDADPNSKIIVLSSSVSFFSWGFLYPVFIAPDGRGGTQITIGCTSKLVQMGPLVTRAHNQCVEAVERAITVARARVA
ncbi:MAG TPA: hypothetical protein VGC41_23170 [Kofleriaceae bacterium]